MKSLAGTLFLFISLGIAWSGMSSSIPRSSEKYGMVDTVTCNAILPDTLFADTVSVYVDTIDVTQWKYQPLTKMPDPSVQQWWHGFNDPLLDSLISMAVRNNSDIKVAARRIELSRLALKQTQSAYYPTLNAQAGWTTDRTSALTGRQRGMETTANYFNLGLNASWEIDVFGRIGKESDMRKADMSVYQADYAAALVSLCSQLTEEYIQLRVYQAQLEVARRLSVSQEEVLRIATKRHECTLASGLDVSQARTVCLSTQATVPTLETSVDQTINAIMVLVGESSAQFASRLAIERPIPLYSMPLDVEITPELLRRRPDVQAAEMQVASYAAQIGVAEKDFLPTLSLDASVGVAAHKLGNLFKHDALTYSVSPTLTWTIFSGFSRKYAVAEAKEQMMMGIDSYNLTLQEAAAEVDNAIVAYRNSLRRIGLLNEVLSESIKSFDYSLDQYKQGLTVFLNLIDSQIDVLDYNNQLVAERGNAQIAVINLYKALGGGW